MAPSLPAHSSRPGCFVVCRSEDQIFLERTRALLLFVVCLLLLFCLVNSRINFLFLSFNTDLHYLHGAQVCSEAR